MPPTRDDAKTPPLEELRALIEQEQKDDPLVGAKVGSKLALEMLLDQLTTEQGVLPQRVLRGARWPAPRRRPCAQHEAMPKAW